MAEATKPHLFFSTLTPSKEELAASPGREYPPLKLTQMGVKWDSQVRIRTKGGFAVNQKGGRLAQEGTLDELYQSDDGRLYFCANSSTSDCKKTFLDDKNPEHHKAIRDIARALLGRDEVDIQSPEASRFFQAYFHTSPEAEGTDLSFDVPKSATGSQHSSADKIKNGLPKRPRASVGSDGSVWEALRHPEEWKAMDCSGEKCTYSNLSNPTRTVSVYKDQSHLKWLLESPKEIESSGHATEAVKGDILSELGAQLDVAQKKDKKTFAVVVVGNPETCAPCKELEPELDKLKDLVGGAGTVLKLPYVDAINRQAGKFQVQKIPSVIVVELLGPERKVHPPFIAAWQKADRLAAEVNSRRTNPR